MTDRLTILQGHVLDKLKELPDASIQCCVTSPPYWGLRNYGTPPQIWDGRHDCEHDLSVPGPVIHKGGGHQGETGERSDRDTEASNETAHRTSGDFCSKCDAWQGHLGLEPTIELYVEHIVQVFREVRRVLRDDGTLWLNIGDSYASSGGHSDEKCNDRRGAYNLGNRPEHNKREFRAKPLAKSGQLKGGCSTWSTMENRGAVPAQANLKPKDMCLIPARVALALQADGWYVRCDVIWSKPNPMPESCTDRPTKSHEYIWLLTKSERYYYDAEAIKEKSSPNTHARLAQATLQTQKGGSKQDDYRKGNNPGEKSRDRTPNEILKAMGLKAGIKVDGVKSNQQWRDAHEGMMMTRNKRSVWTVTTQSFPEAHFATFPEALILPCILAGTSARGCCQICEAPFERVIELGEPNMAHRLASGSDKNGEYHGNNTKMYQQHMAQPASTVKERILKGMVEKKTVDWKQPCGCVYLPAKPCRVLDPFGGSFTTAKVAIEHGRVATIIELKPEYVEMGKRRCNVTPGLAL